MSIADFTLRQLLEAGVHFGHQTHRWNPLMEPYIHSSREGIHIIDLTRTVPLLRKALEEIEKVISNGGSMLFVGTKRQARESVAAAAKRCNQHHVNHRWLGGTLTNWHTVSISLKRLNSIDERIEKGIEGLTKKERLGLIRSQTKLQASLGGIREMENVPNILFVIDVKKEALAVAEAIKLGIPVVAIIDTNCSPKGVTHIIPGNDDSIRSISLYCDLVSSAALQGAKTLLQRAGVDLGEHTDDIEMFESKEQEESTKDAEQSGDDGIENAAEQTDKNVEEVSAVVEEN